MSLHVTSPGGDDIEVLSDHQLAKRLGIDPDHRRHLSQATSWTKLAPVVYATLWQHGPYEDRSGQATGRLGADAGLTVTQVTPVLKSAVGEVCVERTTNAKRTYAIKLVAVPERWLTHLSAVSGHAAAATSPEPGGSEVEVATGPAPPDPPPEGAGPPALIDVDQLVTARNGYVHDGPAELEVAQAVALSLLTQVVEIVTAGRGDAHELERLRLDVVDLGQRLGGQVEDSSKLRRQLRDVGDELSAVKHERDGLRQRLRMAEHNLKVATSGDVQRVIDAEVRKRLDTMMRQAPGDVHARTG